MEIKFFEDPLKRGKPREEVRFNQLGLFVYEDRRRVALGFDITPFQERPCIDVVVTNANGIVAATMHVVDIVENNFSLTIHLRDKETTDQYDVTAVLFYKTPETARQEVDSRTVSFDLRLLGRQES